MLNKLQTERIWQDYSARLRRFLLARVPQPSDADDLLQEILMRSVAHLPAIDDPDQMRAWLYRVARNALADFYRKSKPLEALEREPPAPTEEGLGAMRELENCLTPFLDALPAEQAALLRAVYHEGRAQKEIAKAQGVPYSTLKSQVKSAREALRHQFETCCSMAFDAQGAVIDYQRNSNSCKNC